MKEQKEPREIIPIRVDLDIKTTKDGRDILEFGCVDKKMRLAYLRALREILDVELFSYDDKDQYFHFSLGSHTTDEEGNKKLLDEIHIRASEIYRAEPT